jgi:hypothetical protein
MQAPLFMMTIFMHAALQIRDSALLLEWASEWGGKMGLWGLTMRQFEYQLFVHLVRKVLAAGQRTQGSLATHSPSHSCHGESASVEKRELFGCHLALDKWVSQQHRAHTIDATSHQRIPTAVVEHLLLLGRWHVPLSAKCDGRRHGFLLLRNPSSVKALAIITPSDFWPEQETFL